MFHRPTVNYRFINDKLVIDDGFLVRIGSLLVNSDAMIHYELRMVDSDDC